MPIRNVLESRLTGALTTYKFSPLSMLLGALAMLECMVWSGCGMPAGAGAELPALLATVNGIDSRRLSPSSARVDQSPVEAVIDSQLLQEDAIRNKHDRDPLVRKANVQAHVETLTQAHLQRMAATMMAPTRAEIDAYLAELPEKP
jgi:hypothetical protein